ncbi:lysophospholipid acyltransferase family protein [Marinobacteraceae bacterium S3BR75-40.1]
MKKATPAIYLRSGLFYLLFVTFTIVWCSMLIVVLPLMPRHRRFAFGIGIFTRTVMRLVSFCCGIHWDVWGEENIPSDPCVLYAKHQSTWETFFLQTLFSPQSQVIKKELLSVPFFGWAFRLLGPIAIDRNDKRRATTQVVEKGSEKLQEGYWILIFPEGTRVDPGHQKRFTHGGARLAQAAGHPLLPIAHNAGEFWPNNHFVKFPGRIQLVIGAPIASDNRSVEALTAAGEEWINQTVSAIAGGGQLSPEQAAELTKPQKIDPNLG